jgi:hypothetical protein
MDALALDLGGSAYAGLSGELRFSADGSTSQAALKDSAGGWAAEMAPDNGALRLTLKSSGISDFPRKGSRVESLQLAGVASATGYRIEQIDVRVFDGVLDGSAELDWSAGWSIKGQLAYKQLDAPKLIKALDSGLRVEGKLGGAITFSARAAAARDLQKALNGEGTFASGPAKISGIDLVDAVRRGVRGVARGGETRFDRMSGGLSWQAGMIEFSPLEMEAGLMTAKGRAKIAADTLSGMLDVAIGSGGSRISQAVSLVGSSAEPGVERR